MKILLFHSGTIEINPGPEKTKKNNLSFAVWNLDNSRVFLLHIILLSSGYACHFCVMLYLMRIFLSIVFLSTLLGLINLEIAEAGEYVYTLKNLLIKERRDLETIPETIVAEVKLNRKNIYFVLSCTRIP